LRPGIRGWGLGVGTGAPLTASQTRLKTNQRRRRKKRVCEGLGFRVPRFRVWTNRFRECRAKKRPAVKGGFFRTFRLDAIPP